MHLCYSSNYKLIVYILNFNQEGTRKQYCIAFYPPHVATNLGLADILYQAPL